MKQSEKENTCARRDIDGKIWKQRGGCGAPASGNTGSHLAGLYRFIPISGSKLQEEFFLWRRNFPYAAAALPARCKCGGGEQPGTRRARMPTGSLDAWPAQRAHARTHCAQMDTKSPRRGTGGFSCDFVLSFVDVYVITSRSRPLCFRGSCSP